MIRSMTGYGSAGLETEAVRAAGQRSERRPGGEEKPDAGPPRYKRAEARDQQKAAGE